jgi:beta-galactosidase
MRRSLALLLALATPAIAQAATPAPGVASERLWLGSAWYPEQWPESRWDADLTLMEKAGANVMRVGEFAWARMEPSEGHYDLDWLERAVRAAERHHIKIVLATPTDTPPNWMTTKYPDVMKIASDSTPAGLGGRRQFSISSPRYREFCRKIVAELAKRFGHDPNVIGWQIGNEYTDESYDPAAKAAWHDWLKQKYGTLDRLNEVWTTAYWSQTYFAWDQVPFTDKPGNPGWMMDEKRFITDQWVAFQKNQADVLRAGIDTRQFVTTNLGGLGWADKFDRYAINRDLDLSSWDDYVGTGHLKPDRNGATHDLVRGWKQRNFWVMEAQPGFVNWSPDNNILSRGETRAMAWQAIGHGAILAVAQRAQRAGAISRLGRRSGRDAPALLRRVRRGRPRFRQGVQRPGRHRAGQRGRDRAGLSEPLGDRFPATHQGLRPDRGAARDLPPAQSEAG